LLKLYGVGHAKPEPSHTRPAQERKTTDRCEGVVMPDMTESAALETALAYHRAWTSGDLDRAFAYVADDIICRAPGGDITGRDAYRGFLGGFAANLTGLTDVAAFGDEAHVLLFYYPHTAATSAAPAAEYFTIRDGRIVESLLVFDRLSFTPPPEQ